MSEALNAPTYRLSYHVIQINSNDWMVFHPYSLSIFSLDSDEGRILKLYEEGFDEKIIAKKLKKPVDYVKWVIEDVHNNLIEKKPVGIVKAGEANMLWFLVAGSCNMSCSYCFASEGNYGDSYPALMDKHIARKALDTLLDTFEIMYIYFFGGEPFLNFDTIKYIVEYASSKSNDVHFGVTTNATLLTREVVKFIKDYDIQITVSLDGPELVHDYHRVTKNGEGTHQKVIKTIELLEKYDIKFPIEATYTREAIELGFSLKDIVEYLSKFTNRVLFKPATSFELLEHRLANRSDVLGHPRIYPLIEEYFAYIIDKLCTKEPIYDEVVMQGLYALVTKYLKQHACPTLRYISVYPNGDLYTCHLLKHKTCYMGQINNINGEELMRNWRKVSEVVSKSVNILPLLQKYWFCPFQSLCPAAGTTAHDSYPTIRFTRDFVPFSTFVWEVIVKNIVLCREDNKKWNTLVSNVKKFTKTAEEEKLQIVKYT